MKKTYKCKKCGYSHSFSSKIGKEHLKYSDKRVVPEHVRITTPKKTVDPEKIKFIKNIEGFGIYRKNDVYIIRPPIVGGKKYHNIYNVVREIYKYLNILDERKIYNEIVLLEYLESKSPKYATLSDLREAFKEPTGRTEIPEYDNYNHDELLAVAKKIENVIDLRNRELNRLIKLENTEMTKLKDAEESGEFGRPELRQMKYRIQNRYGDKIDNLEDEIKNLHDTLTDVKSKMEY